VCFVIIPYCLWPLSKVIFDVIIFTALPMVSEDIPCRVRFFEL
jgi:hypothetical protein